MDSREISWDRLEKNPERKKAENVALAHSYVHCRCPPEAQIQPLSCLSDRSGISRCRAPDLAEFFRSRDRLEKYPERKKTVFFSKKKFSSDSALRPGRSVQPSGRIYQSKAKSQRIAAWELLYRVQHPGRYVSRLQTILHSDIAVKVPRHEDDRHNT
jgi:hypothetical protein